MKFSLGDDEHYLNNFVARSSYTVYDISRIYS